MKRLCKKACAVVLTAALSVTAFAVAPDVQAKKAKKKITLNAKSKELTVGKTFKLKVKKVSPKKLGKKVTWKSKKKSIATVSKAGLVTAKSKGKTKIIATSKKDKKVKAVCNISVVPKADNPSQKPSVAPVKSDAPAPSSAVSEAPKGSEAPAESQAPTGLPDPSFVPFAAPTKEAPARTEAPASNTSDPDALKNNAPFKMGTVVNPEKVASEDFTALARKHFDIVSFENEMKGYSLFDAEASREGDGRPVCKFDQADKMVEWAIDNGMHVRGHVLVWEGGMTGDTGQAFFHEGYDLEAPLVDRNTLLQRMQSYVSQVVIHFSSKYPGTMVAWDVVNEAISTKTKDKDSLTGLYLNQDKFRTIIGGDYIKWAFTYAKQAVKETGEDIALYYNDYNTFEAKKKKYILAMVDYLNKDPDNKLIEHMGMEGYILMEWPQISEVGTAMQDYAKKGLKVGINELTVRMYPGMSTNIHDPIGEEEIALHAERCKDLFKEYCKFDKAHPDTLTNVSIWGLLDRPDLLEDTSNYDYQIYGTHSGLFTENLVEKQAFKNVLQVLKENYSS